MANIENTILIIGSDHAGFEGRQSIQQSLKEMGYQVIDVGCPSKESVDYPDIAASLATEWQKQTVENPSKAVFGIALCGTGIGISMALNRFEFLRAALCHTGLEARLTRQHNDANVLVLGARILGEEAIKDCVQTFLNTDFEGGRHMRRVEKLSKNKSYL